MATIPYSTSGRNWTAGAYNALIAEYDRKLTLALDAKTPYCKASLQPLVSGRRFWFVGAEPVMGGTRTALVYGSEEFGGPGVSHSQPASDSAAAALSIAEWHDDLGWALAANSVLAEHSLKIHRRTSPDDNLLRLAFMPEVYAAGEDLVIRPPKYNDMRFLRWGVAELLCEGITALTIESDWDRFGCYRVHNLSWADLTVTYPGGSLTVPKFGCKTLRHHEDGSWETGLNYFWRCKAGADPKVWESSGDEAACNIGHIQVLDLWLDACSWNPDPSVTIPDASARYSSSAPGALYPVVGGGTTIGELRYHGGSQPEPYEISSPISPPGPANRWIYEGLPSLYTGREVGQVATNMYLAESTDIYGEPAWVYGFLPAELMTKPVSTVPVQRTTSGGWILGPMGWCRRDTWTVPINRRFLFFPWSLYSTMTSGGIVLPEIRLAGSRSWPVKFPPGQSRRASNTTTLVRKGPEFPLSRQDQYRQSVEDWSYDVEGGAVTPEMMPLNPTGYVRGLSLNASYINSLFADGNITVATRQILEAPHYVVQTRPDKASDFEIDLRTYRVPCSRELWDWYAWRINSWRRSEVVIDIQDLVIGGIHTFASGAPPGFYQMFVGPFESYTAIFPEEMDRMDDLLGHARTDFGPVFTNVVSRGDVMEIAGNAGFRVARLYYRVFDPEEDPPYPTGTAAVVMDIPEISWDDYTPFQRHVRAYNLVQAGATGGLVNGRSVLFYPVTYRPERPLLGSPSVASLATGVSTLTAPGQGQYEIHTHGTVYVNLG